MFAMIVDDSRSSLHKLKSMIEAEGRIQAVPFGDPVAALEAAKQCAFDLVLVDYIMPSLNGIEFIRALRAMPEYAQVPVVMVTATDDDAVRMEALEAGATDFLPKAPGAIELRVRVRNLIKLSDAVSRLDNQAAWLGEQVEAATKRLLEREEEMIFRLSLAVEYRDNDTGGHTLRVAQYSRILAEELGLPPQTVRQIYLASPLHDVGKVAVPDAVLLKPGRLDEQEFAIIRTHAAVGERILGGSSCDLISLAAEIAGAHHERWDGTGYPRGLAGRAIPLSARIVAIADVFDALTTQRPYKDAMSSDEAFAFIRKERGRHFDPVCADAFLAGAARIVAVQQDEASSTTGRHVSRQGITGSHYPSITAA